MNEYTKNFDAGEKNISFKNEDDSKFVNKIKFGTKIIKKTLNIKFYNQPVYDWKYIKNKVKTLNDITFPLQQ